MAAEHVILLAIRQYEGKSYHSMFADWLMETCFFLSFDMRGAKILLVLDSIATQSLDGF
jgi:hypothetical protein